MGLKYKKYIVFQHDWHYPAGGLGDITASFDTIPECEQFIKERPMDDNEIVDRDTWETVERCPECGGVVTPQDPHAACLDEAQSR